MVPREAMPPVARDIGLVFPLTYYLQVIRGVVLKGIGVRELWPQTLALLGFALVYFTFSVRRFRKQLE
jgi:ABC-2 type transport system permease protein